ncbi:UNVERIFIED_CONTAM: putative RNA-binding Zn ribbon-like protein [Williamsia faeni]
MVTSQDGDVGYVFVSGNLALDLAGTRKWRRSEHEELLHNPSDLAAWCGESGQLPKRLQVDDRSFHRALELREAIYDLAVARMADATFPVADLETVNGLAAGPAVGVELTSTGVVRAGDIDSALAEIARSAVLVLSDADAPIKECGRPSCTRIYLDRSRGARRTWCGMDECGNRVKAAAYRARKRADKDS